MKEETQERLESFAQTSTKLSCCSDTRLQQLLSEASRHQSGIGGSIFSLQLDDMPIFVKKIPLTDIERLPENIMSTANLFNLPPYYQYGIGSAGFSAWRELIAHVMTSNWVISNASTNFPLLYHWRILPNSLRSNDGTKNSDDGEFEDIEAQVKLWGGAPEIRNRLEARQSSTASIVLFLEHFPITLYDWLGTQLAEGGAKAELTISFLDEELRQLSSFTSSRGLVHFDNHFKNILVGGRFALSDFGLTLSKDFELSESEQAFLETHRNYDRCSSIASLVHFTIQFVYGGADWKKSLQECLAGDMSKLTEMGPSIVDTIKKYGPIAEVMVNFNHDLQQAPQTTAYPKAKLDELLLDIDELNV